MRREDEKEVQGERSVRKKADLSESPTLHTSPDASSLILSLDRKAELEWTQKQDVLKWFALSETFRRSGLMSRPSFMPPYDLCEVGFISTWPL